MRGTLITLFNGQLSLLLFFALTAGLVLLWKDRPFLAGAALSLVALKPNAFLLFVPLLGLWLLIQRQWRVIAGSLSGAGLLLATSLLVRPGWLSSWLAVRGKTEATYRTPTVWGAAYLLAPDVWPAVGLLLTICVTAIVGWLVLRRAQRDPGYVIGLALCASLLVTPYAWAYEHALLLLPVGLLYAAARRRWQAWVVWWTLVCLLPWLLFWAAMQLGGDALSVLVPGTTGMALIALLARGSSLPRSASRREAPAAASRACAAQTGKAESVDEPASHPVTGLPGERQQRAPARDPP
jgi:hypothetical protein